MTTVTTRTHFRCPYQSCSVLLHEPQPHADHICVHVYVDVLHKCQVLVRSDWGYTLTFTDKYTKSHLHPYASDMHSDLLCSYDAYPHTPHRPLVLVLGMQAGGLAPKVSLSVNTRAKLHLVLRSHRPKASRWRPTSVTRFIPSPHIQTYG
jgi:hypothetical protein